jgi:WD40 repeat protein
MYARYGIEQAPLQVYVSAALFTPSSTVLREVGRKTRLISYVKRSPPTPEHWSTPLLTLEGHSASVDVVQFSPDGSKLASASWDKKVKVWDASTGARLHALKGHSGGVLAVQFSLDGSKLASASWDNNVKVWDASTGAHLHTLEGHSGGVSAVQFSPDGSKLASASYDNKVKVWDLNTNLPIQTIHVAGHVGNFAFSPDRSNLNTDIGSFKLEFGIGGLHDRNACAFHFHVVDNWILRHGHRTTWLPPEFRSYVHAMSSVGVMAFGCSSGYVSSWEIEE